MSGAIYTNQDGTWHPHALAKGPFAGQHGGAVAGALSAAMEARARVLNAGEGTQISVYFLRPATVEPVEISVTEIRRGERTYMLEARMEQDKRLIATASAIFAKPQNISDIPSPPPFAQSPGGANFDIGDFSDTPWFRDAVEMRRDDKGWFWLRHKIPIAKPMGPLSFSVSLADWAPGMTRPEWFGTNNVVSFPNADITLHLARPPEGEWLGLEGLSTWYDNGTGITFANLYDRSGFFGRSAQSVVLVTG